MQNIRLTLWAALGAVSVLWLAFNPAVFQPASFFALRADMVQISGILAMVCMSIAMVLAMRPRWPENWFGGLDKMYRLHKWLGISALVLGVVHWLWAKGPKWATQWGLLERPARGPRPLPDSAIEQFFGSLRGTAEGIGEWAFYGAVVLIVLALIKWFPYRLFYKTHRLLAAAYLVLVFHAVILVKFSAWNTPVGWLMIPLLAAGTWAAVVVLFRRVAADRRVSGKIIDMHYYPGVKVLETRISIPEGWPGHQPGQFAFATSNPSEGPHPYTIASSWNDIDREITFIVKELGDHTTGLRTRLQVGQAVQIEGPYGCFTFDDDCAEQIWIGGGIGITPFIARMQQLAADGNTASKVIHLFHTTADHDAQALAKVNADARAAGIRLHILVDSRDGRLSGDRIRAEVPNWRDASIWFCGPSGFGQALRADFAAQGLPVKQRFHQELFAMR